MEVYYLGRRGKNKIYVENWEEGGTYRREALIEVGENGTRVVYAKVTDLNSVERWGEPAQRKWAEDLENLSKIAPKVLEIMEAANAEYFIVKFSRSPKK